MTELLIQAPVGGLNALVPVNMLSPQEAAYGSQNVYYEDGQLKQAHGTVALDMTTNGIYTSSKLPVLAIIPFKEQGDLGLDHLIAATTTKIFERDMCNNDWQARDPSAISTTYEATVSCPISAISIAHDDSNVYTEDDSTRGDHEYYHLVVCAGSNADIIRWAGGREDNFYPLIGGGGYHDGTKHRALQIGQFHNRIILINPLEYNQESRTWIETRYRVRWPQIGKIQSWSGTGSGFYDLLDTGDRNVWSAQLGNQYIIYQYHTIWSLDYVGGTTVFVPTIQIPNLGLLAPHLLVAKSNVHYFVGDDYNVYVYFGGTSKQAIGDKVQKFIKDDINRNKKGVSWMAMEPDSKRLWVYVPTGSRSYPTKGYGMDMKTGAWMVREFAHRYSPATDGGITAITSTEPQVYTVGDSYNTRLSTLSHFDISEDGAANEDATERYADTFMDSTIEANYDWFKRDFTKATAPESNLSTYSWCAGGVSFCKVGATIKNEITRNDILMVEDGSTYNIIGGVGVGCRYGTHFYTISDVTNTTAWLQVRESTAAVGDDPDVKPVSVCGVFYSACDDDCDVSETYNHIIDDTVINEKLLIGDSSGFVYSVEPTAADDAGTNMDRRHLSPVIDLQQPEKYKRWNTLEFVTDGTNIVARTRTASFDTSNTGWVDTSYDLTEEHELYKKYINRSQKRLQFEFLDTTGSSFNIREVKLDFDVEENR